MNSLRNERWLWVACIAIVIIYAFVFARETSVGLIANDAAKYALNIPYPHPPLGRWFMLASQAMFGATAFAARLPSLLFELAAIFFFFRSSRRLLPTFLLALTPIFPLWIGQGYQTSFLFCAVALFVFGLSRKMVEARLGYVTLGYLLAIWTQLQGILLLPAVLLLFWQAWREGLLKLRFENLPIWFLFNVATHTILVVLWFLGTPLAVADALLLAGSSTRIAEKAMGFVGSDFFPLAILLVLLNVILSVRWWKGKRASVSALFITSLLFLGYLFSNHASYYFPYILALCFWGMMEFISLFPRWEKMHLLFSVLVMGAGALLFAPRLLQAPVDQRTEMNALRSALAEERSVMALGFYGYESSYLLGKSYLHFSNNPDLLARINTVIVFRPKTLSDEEREFLETFSTPQTFGDARLYRR